MPSTQRKWLESIGQQIEFYAAMPAQDRRDDEFDWAWLSRPGGDGPVALAKELLKGVIRRLPVESRWKQTDDSYSLEWVRRNADALWDTRHVFVDDMSRLVFDLHVVLRAVSHRKYYFPRTEFDDLVDVVKEEPFSHGDLPTDYLGLPLRVFDLRLKDGAKDTTIRVVSTHLQVALLNGYRQYFIRRGAVRFWPRRGDVVLDCGACIGEVSLLFGAMVGPTGAVHTFDPVPLHAQYCRFQGDLNPSLREVLRINVLAVGAESKKSLGTGRADAAGIQPGGLAVDDFSVTSIDDYVENGRLDPVDVIKMDIEGAEMAALRGAEKTIRRFKPKLTISAYHKPQDLWEIPRMIKSLAPDYELYFGHHTPIQWESVFYASVPGG